MTTTVVSIDLITHLHVVSTKAVCYLSCGRQITTKFAQNTKKFKISTSELPKLTFSPSTPTTIEHPQEMHSQYLRAIFPEFSVIYIFPEPLQCLKWSQLQHLTYWKKVYSLSLRV